MTDRPALTAWWQRESQRSFTKLECGLLGALFAAIAVVLLLVLRLAA